MHNNPHIQNEPARHPELMLADLLKELDSQTFDSCKAAEPMDALDPIPGAPNIQRSSREKRLTPKMQEFMEQQSVQKEKRVYSAYEKWKVHVREVRKNLKGACSDEDLCAMMETLEELEAVAKVEYNSLRETSTPSQEVRRKIDACAAVTADLMQFMKVRLSETGEDFDAEAERPR